MATYPILKFWEGSSLSKQFLEMHTGLWLTHNKWLYFPKEWHHRLKSTDSDCYSEWAASCAQSQIIDLCAYICARVGCSDNSHGSNCQRLWAFQTFLVIGNKLRRRLRDKHPCAVLWWVSSLKIFWTFATMETAASSEIFFFFLEGAHSLLLTFFLSLLSASAFSHAGERADEKRTQNTSVHVTQHTRALNKGTNTWVLQMPSHKTLSPKHQQCS